MTDVTTILRRTIKIDGDPKTKVKWYRKKYRTPRKVKKKLKKKRFNEFYEIIEHKTEASFIEELAKWNKINETKTFLPK